MTKNKVEEEQLPGRCAARRAGLRAVVTKALAGGLAAYLCVRERETLRLRSNCLSSKQGRSSLQLPRPRSPAALRAAACLGQDMIIRDGSQLTTEHYKVAALLWKKKYYNRFDNLNANQKSIIGETINSHIENLDLESDTLPIAKYEQAAEYWRGRYLKCIDLTDFTTNNSYMVYF